MYVERVPNRNSPPAVLLRESWRENGKTRKRTVANLSSLSDETVEAVRSALKGDVVPAAMAIAVPEKRLEITNVRQHGHVAAIVAMVKRSGLLPAIDRKPSRQRDIVVAMVADRLLHGDSKLATARHCQKETAATTLGELLSLEDLDEHECYRAMDWLLERQESIQRKLAKKHLDDGGPVLFDLSSSYFEGHTCPLAKHGYSRDKRGDLPQVNYGMYCNAQWITALNSVSIAKLQRQGAIQLSLFDQRDLASVTHADYPDERLIVCRNPLLADERARKREALLGATEKLLAKVKAKVDRKRKPLRGKSEIGVEVGKVVNRKKVAKHFYIEIDDDRFEYSRNQEKIHVEASLDGLYTIRSNVQESKMPDEQVVAHYKNLASVERAFRSLKSIDLRVRPIHHRLADRVRSHIFLCTLAYYIEHQLRQSLAGLMFVDEEKPLVETRDSIVSPACRSESAKRKDATRRNEAGFRLSSFRDILETLSAMTRSTVIIRNHPKGRFTTTSRPTPYQQEIIRHLGIERHL